MLLFAIAHYFVFSHKPYIDPAAAQAPCIHSCLRMLDVRDVADDMKEHFVDPISRPSIERFRRRFSDKSGNGASSNSAETESDPLLKSSSSSYGSGGKLSISGGLNDGSLSYSVVTYDDMTVQHRLAARPALTVLVEEEREESSSSSDGASTNGDESSGNASSNSKDIRLTVDHHTEDAMS